MASSNSKGRKRPVSISDARPQAFIFHYENGVEVMTPTAWKLSDKLEDAMPKYIGMLADRGLDHLFPHRAIVRAFGKVVDQWSAAGASATVSKLPRL